MCRPAGTSGATAAIIGTLTAAMWMVFGAPVAAQDTAAAEATYVRGGEVYQANCAACHGTRGQGGLGPGVLDGPPLLGLELAYVDLTVRTGRMPIAEPSVGVHTEQLDEADRQAMVVYAAERFELTGDIPTVTPGDAARGQATYVRNCAACHGAAGGGGISGANVQVPPLIALDGVAIAEATRVGPFEMPAFDAAVLDDQDIDDMVGYLELAAGTPRTPVGVREVDQLTGGLFALGLGLAAALVTMVVARARRWSSQDPEGFHAAPAFASRPEYEPSADDPPTSEHDR